MYNRIYILLMVICVSCSQSAGDIKIAENREKRLRDSLAKLAAQDEKKMNLTRVIIPRFITVSDTINIDLINEYIELLKVFDPKKWSADKTKLFDGVEEINHLSIHVLMACNSKNLTTHKAALKLRASARDVLRQAFMWLRVRFFENIKESYWSEDIQVTLSGDGDLIFFYGRTFYTNKNIKSKRDDILPFLWRLRFKEEHYAMYRNDPSYQAFRIDTPADTAIVAIDADEIKI